MGKNALRIMVATRDEQIENFLAVIGALQSDLTNVRLKNKQLIDELDRELDRVHNTLAVEKHRLTDEVKDRDERLARLSVTVKNQAKIIRDLNEEREDKHLSLHYLRRSKYLGIVHRQIVKALAPSPLDTQVIDDNSTDIGALQAADRICAEYAKVVAERNKLVAQRNTQNARHSDLIRLRDAHLNLLLAIEAAAPASVAP